MKKPEPGTRIIQKAASYHKYEVVPDDGTEQSVDDDRFAVKPLESTPGDEVGTFPLSVLTQDNFYINDE